MTRLRVYHSLEAKASDKALAQLHKALLSIPSTEKKKKKKMLKRKKRNEKEEKRIKEIKKKKRQGGYMENEN